MKQTKITLVIIIILLSISIIGGGYGAVLSLSGYNKVEPENERKQFHFEGKLYFYTANELLGTYTCQNDDCGYATITIDDNKVSLNYYDEYDTPSLKMINKKYAFIEDGTNNIILYDIVNQKELEKFSAVKYYGEDLENGYIIVKNNDFWGVVQLTDTSFVQPIKFKYTFIGVSDKYDEENDELKADKFVVKDVNGWKVISNKDVDISAYFLSEIYDYNDEYVITKSNNVFFLNDMNGVPLTSYNFTAMDFIGNYVGVLNDANEYYIFDPFTNQELTKKYVVNNIEEVSYEKTINGIELSINDELKEVVN